MILALVIFLITYALMLSLQKYRPWIALCSAAVFLILGLCGVYALTPAAALMAGGLQCASYDCRNDGNCPSVY